MKTLLAITAREMRERFALPLAMLCGGFVLLYPAVNHGEPALPLAVVGAAPSAWVLAVLLGGSVIARDLSDGRLGFFFTRPVPWWSIAGGKLLAALLLTIVSATAGLLPALIADWNPSLYMGELRQMLTGGGVPMMLALLIALVGFGHVASVVYRARSLWAAADFVLLAGSSILGILLYRAFARLGFDASLLAPPSAWAVVPILLLIAVVPLAATAAQVAIGRSDLQRGHRALSVTFWSGVLVWFAALGGFLARERAVTPAALTWVQLSGAAPDGRLIGIQGSSGRAGAAFVYDTASGRFLRQPVGSWPAFSADGRHVAWVESAPFWRHERTTDVQLARLDGSDFKVESVELSTQLSGEGSVGLALSPQADRLAIVQPRTLSVFELPSGRALSSSSASDGDWMAAAFLKDGQLRAFRRVRPSLGPPGAGMVPGHVEVVAMSGGVPASAVRLEAEGFAVLISPADEDFVLLHEPLAPRRISQYDTRTGRRVATFAGQDGLEVMDALLCANGRVAVLEAQGPSVRLRLALEGQPDLVAVLPEGSAVISELPDGLLAMGRFIPARGRFAVETLFFSSDTAEARGREAGLVPALRPRLRPARRISGTAAQLFRSDKDELVQFDPSSRERKVLLPAAPASR